MKPDAAGRDKPASLACILVTYHPDTDILQRQLEALPADCALVVVDNASGAAVHKRLQALTATHARACIVVNEHNRGLAAAINQGAHQAMELWPDTRYLLLLDQDSEPRPGSIQRLLQSLTRLAAAEPPVGCVGPMLLDSTSGLQHGFHQHTRWRWKRIYPLASSGTPVRCANLNGSGTLTSSELFLRLGGLDEDLFIDHVDTEWAFRVQNAGYTLFGIPDAVFEHRMGESSRRIWLFGWRTWPMRAPQRHYYLFRNAILLMRRDYVPTVWKAWAVLKLLLTALVQGLIDEQPLAQWRHMVRGVRDGLARLPENRQHGPS